MVVLFFVYLLFHFLLYVSVVRHRPPFHREMPIFLYHVLPASVVGLVAVGAILTNPTPDALMEAALVIAVQGIYSLSFLELWALAQGGYSINILIQLDSGAAKVDPAGWERFGADKKRDRLRGLRGLRLIESTAGNYHLTRAGRLLAGFLHMVRRVANVRESG